MKLSYVLLCMVFVSTSVLANSNQIINNATSLLKLGKPASAYKLLIKNQKTLPKTPQNLFLLGMSAKESGKTNEAIKYFQQVLKLDPRASRVKLELAVLLANKGDKPQAKKYLRDVKKSRPPGKVIKNVDQFMTTLDKNSPKKWKIVADIGWLYDSNVNIAPDVDTLLIFGLPFRLSDSAKPQPDTAITSRVKFTYVNELNDDFLWRSDISLNNTRYKDTKILDTTVLSASTGALWEYNDKTIFSLPIVADKIKVGHSSNYYSYSYGVAPGIKYKANERLWLSLQATASKKKYKERDQKNLTKLSLTPLLTYQIDNKSIIKAGFTLGENRSGLDVYSNELKSIQIDYTRRLASNWRGSINASYTNVNTKGQEPAYTVKRRDKNTRISTNLVYHAPKIKSNIIFTVSDTNNKSNIETYKYDKQQVSLILSREF